MFIFSFIALCSSLPWQDEDVLATAWDRFAAAESEQQRAVVDEIEDRARRSEDPKLASLVAAAARARGALHPLEHRPPELYDGKVYAPKEWAAGRASREPIDPDSVKAVEITNRHRPWESLPPLRWEVRYDYARGEAVKAAERLTPFDRLENALDGWPPNADSLIASLQKSWDHRREYREMAAHFAHVYCDLSGNAYPGITIYDALASTEGLDMPDVDVIPFARGILNDRSYKSPIPPTARRERLYRKIKDDFKPYFQHRSFVETASVLYLSPDADFRSQHEGMRQNLLYCFTALGEDPKKIGQLIKQAKDRGGFMDETLQLVKRDGGWLGKVQRFRAERNESRWTMHRIALEVLREHGFVEN